MTHLIKSWNNRAIRIREDRYVSLTDMAQAAGKQFGHWYSNHSSKSYLETLSSKIGIPITRLIDVSRGGSAQQQGTWGHPKVALRFAQWCSDEFAVQVDEWIDQLLTTGSVQLGESQAPYFYRRLQAFQQKTGRIPSGYFCIFSETVELISQLEVHGYEFPDHLIIDISIGKCWCNYMRNELGIDPDDVCMKYNHWYPGQPHPVKARIYPLQLLPTFRSWFDICYSRQQMLQYMKKNAPEALPAVNRFLGLIAPGV